MVHDEQALCQTGDTVRIKEVMKMSKHKKHTLVEILKSEHIEFQSVEPQWMAIQTEWDREEKKEEPQPPKPQNMGHLFYNKNTSKK